MTDGKRFLSFDSRRGPVNRLVSVSGRADIVTYDIKSPRWSAPPLNIAIMTDFHAMRPWSPLRDTRRHVDQVNDIAPDIVFLLGDYTAAYLTPGIEEDNDEMAEVLAELEAPLGVHAILGNHDWIDDPLAKETGYATSDISQSLTKAGLRPLINSSRRINHGASDFWIVGLDAQTAPKNGKKDAGRHDADQAFAEVPDEGLAILLAHEPDYFVFGDRRPVLQLSGHTHGGQANFFGWRPFTPSDYASRYAYGHIEEDGQHLVVSAGLGYTHIPMRIAVPPEITLVRLSNGEE